MRSSSFWRSVFITALIAAVLDLAGAIFSFKASRGAFPVNILKYIAGGLLKDKAMNGGTEMHVLGGVLHYFISLVWTVLFYFMYPKLKFLHKNYMFNAFVYGILIWCIMNLVVLPLSAWKAPISFQNLKEIIKAASILILCVALPIAFRSKKYYQSNVPN